jgi:5-methyltetrahydrofolate--homocysteine methyltransferase
MEYSHLVTRIAATACREQERTGMAEEEDDIILSELDDDELVQQMHDDLYDGLKEEIEEAVGILLERGWQARQRTAKEQQMQTKLAQEEAS